MAITYPAGYQGGYPNIELLLKGLFTDAGLGGVHQCYWLPDAETTQGILDSGQGILRIYRTGGYVNPKANRDEPRVQIAAFTPSREQSWELIEFTRQVLSVYIDAVGVVPGTVHKLGCVGELVCPQWIPERIRDERLVPVTFKLHTWKPGGLGNYREAFGL